MILSFFGYINKDSKADIKDPAHSLISDLLADNMLGSVVSDNFAVYPLEEEELLDSQRRKVLSDSDYVICVNGNVDLDLEQPLPLVAAKLLYETDQLLGEFSAVVYDKKEEVLYLIRDTLGHRPIYYIDSGLHFIFSTDLFVLKQALGSGLEMDINWISDALSSIKSETWRTPYEGIKKLSPGSIMKVKDEIQISSFWHFPEAMSQDQMSYEVAVEQLKAKLGKAMKRALGDHQVLGTELSGGLDSSALTCLSLDMRTETANLYCFSHGFSDQSLGKFYPYRDERYFIELLKEEKRIENHFYCDADGQGLLDMLKHNVKLQSGPTQQGYSMFSDLIYKKAKDHGVHHLLSGFGGDEAVTSRVQGYFEELSLTKNSALLKEELKAYVALKGGGKMEYLIRYFLLRQFPGVYKALKRLLKSGGGQQYSGFAIDENWRKKEDLQQRYKDLKGLQREETTYKSQIKRLLHNHVSQRLEYSYMNAKSYGIEYAYPLLDMELVSFYISLPLAYKFRAGFGRAIFRDAMKGVLPEKIRLRRDKSMAAIPTVHQRFLNDYSAIIEFILHCERQNTFHYLSYTKMLAWAERIKDRTKKGKKQLNPLAFFNSLQILLLQEMERTGEFKSGIRT